MQLVFEQIRAGGDRNLGYLLADRDAGQGVLIDPSFSPEAFVCPGSFARGCPFTGSTDFPVG